MFWLTETQNLTLRQTSNRIILEKFASESSMEMAPEVHKSSNFNVFSQRLWLTQKLQKSKKRCTPESKTSIMISCLFYFLVLFLFFIPYRQHMHCSLTYHFTHHHFPWWSDDAFWLRITQPYRLHPKVKSTCNHMQHVTHVTYCKHHIQPHKMLSNGTSCETHDTV